MKRRDFQSDLPEGQPVVLRGQFGDLVVAALTGGVVVVGPRVGEVVVVPLADERLDIETIHRHQDIAVDQVVDPQDGVVPQRGRPARIVDRLKDNVT